MSCGAGLVCPVDNANKLVADLESIYKESIAQDVEENGINAIVRRELNNHEAYYTGDTDTTEDALADYPVSVEDIRKVFRNKNYQPISA